MPVITGALPIDEWTHYLEHGDEQHRYQYRDSDYT